MMKTQAFDNLVKNIREEENRDIETQTLMMIDALRNQKFVLSKPQKMQLARYISEDFAMLNSWNSERYTFKHEAPPVQAKEIDIAYMYLEISPALHLKYTVKDQFNEVHSASIPFNIIGIPVGNMLPEEFSQQQYSRLIAATSSEKHTLSEEETKVKADYFIREAIFYMEKAIEWGYNDPGQSLLKQLKAQKDPEDIFTPALPENTETEIETQTNQASPTFFADKRGAYKRKVAEIVEGSDKFISFKQAVVAREEPTKPQDEHSASSSSGSNYSPI